MKIITSRYLSFRVDIEEAEIEAWAEFISRPKDELSRAVYSLVRGELANLKKVSLATRPRIPQRGVLRRLYLHILPEYADEMRFIRVHIRRPAFRTHLKALLLYGESLPLPAPVTTGAMAEAPVVGKPEKLSPRTLFSRPKTEIIKAIVTDLHGAPESIDPLQLHYDWMEVPPSEYPEETQSLPPFGALVRYWQHYGGIREK